MKSPELWAILWLIVIACGLWLCWCSEEEEEEEEDDDPEIDANCDSCTEEVPRRTCPKSRRPCGHCCNHSWSHDHCCWCGRDFATDADEPEATC